MKGSPAIYLGRIVEKKHFRVFVYGANGEKKLVESWDAFEAAMQSGIWFDSLENAELSKSVSEEIEEPEIDIKPKSKANSRSRVKLESVQEVDNTDTVLSEVGSVFEEMDAS